MASVIRRSSRSSSRSFSSSCLKCFDVGLSPVPPYDFASFIPQGLDAHNKPAKYPIMAANKPEAAIQALAIFPQK
jgi:hypothetical protein